MKLDNISVFSITANKDFQINEGIIENWDKLTDTKKNVLLSKLLNAFVLIMQ